MVDGPILPHIALFQGLKETLLYSDNSGPTFDINRLGQFLDFLPAAKKEKAFGKQSLDELAKPFRWKIASNYKRKLTYDYIFFMQYGYRNTRNTRILGHGR